MKDPNKVTIIAEAGVNHNGNINIAFDLVDAAVEAGADIVKFQTFNPDKIVTKYSKKAEYQIKNIGNIDKQDQYSMLKNLQLSIEDHKLLISRCKKYDIEFLSTGFDLESLELLNSLELKRFKIPSGEITNLPYLRKIAEFSKPIILSTGMANLEEIEASLNIFFDKGFSCRDITLLQCTTEYPAPIDEINLKVMKLFQDKFKVEVGLSDHSEGIEVALAAAALGAKVIEKHITLDKKLPGPDHVASLEPDQFKKMVAGIRNILRALGDEKKIVTRSEFKNKDLVRKSLVAIKVIKKGDLFTENNVGCKRPGHGISPMKIDQIIGQNSKKIFQ